MSGAQRAVVVELLLAARWQPDEVYQWYGKSRFVVRRGQLFASEETIARWANVSRRVVRTTLAVLVTDGFITRERGLQAARCPYLISIVNYDRYQVIEEESAREVASRRPTGGPQEAPKKQDLETSNRSSTGSLVEQVEQAEKGDDSLQRVIEVWNRLCVPAGFSRTRSTPQQRKAARTRMREPGWLESFETACKYIASEPFYRGGGSSGWVATLGWLLKPGNSEKTAERAGTVRGNIRAGATAPAEPHRTETKRILL